MRALYVTGEESLQQVTLRARRLNLGNDKFQLLTETRVERILELAKKHQPQVMVIDSIQTIYTEMLQSTPGAVARYVKVPHNWCATPSRPIPRFSWWGM